LKALISAWRQADMDAVATWVSKLPKGSLRADAARTLHEPVSRKLLIDQSSDHVSPL
jgi:hypothetical protein